MLDTASRNRADLASCAYPGAPSWVSPVGTAVALMGPRPVAARRAVRLNLDMTTPFPYAMGVAHTRSPGCPRTSRRRRQESNLVIRQEVAGLCAPGTLVSVAPRGQIGGRVAPCDVPGSQARHVAQPRERGCIDSNYEVTVRLRTGEVRDPRYAYPAGRTSEYRVSIVEKWVPEDRSTSARSALPLSYRPRVERAGLEPATSRFNRSKYPASAHRAPDASIVVRPGRVARI